MKRVLLAIAVVIGISMAAIACDPAYACADTLTAVDRSGGGSSFGGGSRGGSGIRSGSGSRGPTRTGSGTKSPTSKTGSKGPTSKPGSKSPSSSRVPKSISTRPKGIAPGVKAPTSRTNFSTTYRNRVMVNGRRTTVVYVYHSPGYYNSPSFLALDIALRLADPYYPPNYYNRFSPWYHHPVLISSHCHANVQAPSNERPDAPPGDDFVVNETTTTLPPDTTTTLVAPTTSTTLG